MTDEPKERTLSPITVAWVVGFVGAGMGLLFLSEPIANLVAIVAVDKDVAINSALSDTNLSIKGEVWVGVICCFAMIGAGLAAHKLWRLSAAVRDARAELSAATGMLNSTRDEFRDTQTRLTEIGAKLAATEAHLEATTENLDSINTRLDEECGQHEATRRLVAGKEDELTALRDLNGQLQLQIANLRQSDPLLNNAKREYAELVENAAAALKLLLPEPTHKITRIDETTALDKDGSAICRKLYTLEGGALKTSRFNMTIESDSTADPVSFLSDIKFEAREIDPENDHKLIVVPTIWKPHFKQVTLIFDPPIPPGDERHFEIRFEWRRFAADILSKNSTKFFASYVSSDRKDEAFVSYEIRATKLLGNLQCRVTEGEPQKMRRLPEPDHWSWRYENTDMEMNGTRIEFCVERVPIQESQDP